jgi:beta-galactosidase
MQKPQLGVCYYPEQWPAEWWREDARRMADLGLAWVRIGEFAWSRLEPAQGRLSFGWLDDAIGSLGDAGLKIVLGTPTATPPRWLVEKMPDMLPVDREGRIRRFGSRRHYCSSHRGYRAECARIVTELAQRYGENPFVQAWQIDNEYGCHDTTLSFSAAALEQFRAWLEAKYRTTEALNRAWGNVFWSMEYSAFSQIDLPNLTVTEANPAHWMDFHRFSSDQVVSFNALQAAILRRYAPGREILHNFMGKTLSFDHFRVGQDLDLASWDSYPLGFLEDRSNASPEFRNRFARSGDPDFQAFHHDLYRAVGKKGWWVMEQQPGPVNWAPHNPVPLPGMARLWTWEAIAHGAAVVSYFRWRQAPFGQEQMHSGLLEPDSRESPAFDEIRRVALEIGKLPDRGARRADCAIVFDYPSAWAWEIQQHGAEFSYFDLVFDYYRSLRRLGMDVDFTPADRPDLAGRRLVVIPGLFAWNRELIEELRRFDGETVIGPRSGSKTADFAIPAGMPPDLPPDVLSARIGRVESLRRDGPIAVGSKGGFRFWREFAQPGPGCEISDMAADGFAAVLRQDRVTYIAGWPDEALMQDVFVRILGRNALAHRVLPDEIRLRRSGHCLFAFNYGSSGVDLRKFGIDGDFLLGSAELGGADVAILRI